MHDFEASQYRVPLDGHFISLVNYQLLGTPQYPDDVELHSTVDSVDFDLSFVESDLSPICHKLPKPIRKAVSFSSQLST